MPIRSFDDAKTIDGIRHETFQHAAIAAGIVHDGEEALLCFKESQSYCTPPQLRSLFVTLTTEGYATMKIWDDPAMRDNLSDGLDAASAGEALQLLLQDLQQRFNVCGKSLSDYGFPDPIDHLTELDIEHLRFPHSTQSNLFNCLEAQYPSTHEQQVIIDKVIEAVESKQCFDPPSLFFLGADAGTGKTNVAKKLTAKVRSMSKIVKICASTALAAQNYVNDASTAHELWCLPVIEDEMRDIDDEKIKCMFHFRPERKQLLDSTSLFIWDEFPSNHRECFEAVYTSMHGLRGKVVLAMGDWKQILPVVSRGDKSEVLDSCMFSSPLWERFEKLTLETNMRLSGAASDEDAQTKQNYATMIKNLAANENTIHYSDITFEHNNGERKDFVFLHVSVFNEDDACSMRASINWLFPDDHYDALTASNNTILATTNDEVDKWNDKISSLNPSAESIMFSKTWFSEVDDLHGNMKFMLNETALNNINRNGVPPHQLKLKVDDICILMQNINVKDGITNNTRVRILRISNNVIVGRTLTEKPKVIVIPRVRFRFRLPYAQSYELVRSQFPLRRAFALTYNKSQGQTLKKVLLDVRTSLFAHGFLYVGLSRVQDPKDVAFFVNNSLLHSNPSPSSWHNKPVISNVVYFEVFNVNI
jgi:hypothetical protein